MFCFLKRYAITSEAEVAFVDIPPNPTFSVSLQYMPEMYESDSNYTYPGFHFTKKIPVILFIRAMTFSMSSQSHMFSSSLLNNANILDFSLVKVQ